MEAGLSFTVETRGARRAGRDKPAGQVLINDTAAFDQNHRAHAGSIGQGEEIGHAAVGRLKTVLQGRIEGLSKLKLSPGMNCSTTPRSESRVAVFVSKPSRGSSDAGVTPGRR